MSKYTKERKAFLKNRKLFNKQERMVNEYAEYDKKAKLIVDAHTEISRIMDNYDVDDCGDSEINIRFKFGYQKYLILEEGMFMIKEVAPYTNQSDTILYLIPWYDVIDEKCIYGLVSEGYELGFNGLLQAAKEDQIEYLESKASKIIDKLNDITKYERGYKLRTTRQQERTTKWDKKMFADVIKMNFTNDPRTIQPVIEILNDVVNKSVEELK